MPPGGAAQLSLVSGAWAGGSLAGAASQASMPASSRARIAAGAAEPRTDIRANGLVTPLDGTGATYIVFVGGSATTHLVLDLSGYFE